ncbi:3813_t:CDS:10, partial [Acaulospora colombiana]
PNADAPNTQSSGTHPSPPSTAHLHLYTTRNDRNPNRDSELLRGTQDYGSPNFTNRRDCKKDVTVTQGRMPSQPSTTYIHGLTSSFASTLDEIPQDMCRHFADLRELDAVLSQSLSGITKRIEELTERIEDGLYSLESAETKAADPSNKDTNAGPIDEASKKEGEVIGMFQLLHEIADDTGRIKLGGEDKIRVASLAADHLDAAYALEILAPNTVYPHVPPSALIDPAPENRRGAPRRFVAVQSGSYGLPYLNNAAQANTGGAVYHPSRNESASRGANGGVDTPNKRRRLQNQAGGINPSHLHPRGGDPDTDDYSTPRRGHAALDAEAYRPGGNTASRARAQNRKKEGKVHGNQAPLDPTIAMNVDRMGMGAPNTIPGQPPMTGADPGFIQSTAPTSHKPQAQNGRSRTSNSQQAQPRQSNANPQPQQYAMHYPPGYEDERTKHMFIQAQLVDPNMNRGMNRQQMDATAAAAAYQQHHGAMNMNPNLNHMPGMGMGAYPVGMGMGMVALPPPPLKHKSQHEPSSSGNGGSRHSAPGGSLDVVAGGASSHGGAYTTSSKVSSNANRDVVKERDQGGPNSSASGGLMPIPMMTSLPPVTSLAHGHQSTNTPLALPGSNQHSALIGDSSMPKSRRYSQSGYGGSYATSDTQGGSMGSSYGNSHSNYQPSSTTNTSRPSSTSLYNHNGPASRDEKVPSSRTDMHPSLSASNSAPTSAKEGQSGFNRETSGPASAGSGSGALHASLARDPPFRVNSAASDRSEREAKSGNFNRSRAGTTTNPPDPSMMNEKDYAYTPSVIPVGGEREGDGGYSRHPSLHTSGSGSNMQGVMSSSGNRYPYASKESSMKGDEREMDPERRGMTSPDTGGRRSTNIEHIIDDPKEWRFDKRTKRGGPAGTITTTGDSPPATWKNMVASTKRGDMSDGIAMDIDPKGVRTPVRGGTDNGEAIEDDQKPYCICGQPSYGQMIGCDDSECEYEWTATDNCLPLFICSSIGSASESPTHHLRASSCVNGAKLVEQNQAEKAARKRQMVVCARFVRIVSAYSSSSGPEMNIIFSGNCGDFGIHCAAGNKRRGGFCGLARVQKPTIKTLTETFALHISGGSDALIARNEQQALEARGEFLGVDVDVMEKRGIADEDMFGELVARSPEPEPMPFDEDVFELDARDLDEDLEARSIEDLEPRDPKNRQRQSKSARKITGKVKKFKNKGVNNFKAFVNAWKRDEDGSLEARNVDEFDLETRSFDEPDLEVRSFDDEELEVRSIDEPEIEARDFEEEDF